MRCDTKLYYNGELEYCSVLLEICFVCLLKNAMYCVVAGDFNTG